MPEYHNRWWISGLWNSSYGRENKKTEEWEKDRVAGIALVDDKRKMSHHGKPITGLVGTELNVQLKCNI